VKECSTGKIYAVVANKNKMLFQKSRDAQIIHTFTDAPP
jgi:hypothetical protein